jgi:hypothetical protein
VVPVNTAVAVLAGLVLAGLVFAGLVRVYVVGHRLTRGQWSAGVPAATAAFIVLVLTQGWITALIVVGVLVFLCTIPAAGSAGNGAGGI